MNTKLYSLLCCPACEGDLVQSEKKFTCSSCKKKYPIQNGIPNFSLTITEKGMKLSQEKWDEKYLQDTEKNIIDELNFLDKKFFTLTWNQIAKQRKLQKKELFLEIGCGTFYLGRHLAKDKYTVIGIDMSMHALQLAKKVFENEKITNYLLVCGNVLNMPFKKDSFDLIYGAGVIEHFKNTGEAVGELARITKKGGVSFNTVPYLNIGTLTYRQVWGNIPRFPVIEQILTFVHTKVLGARHMRFGYELSFTRSYLERTHKKAGFKSSKSGKFKCELDFDYLPTKFLKNAAKKLAQDSPLFWPMVFVVGKR